MILMLLVLVVAEPIVHTYMSQNESDYAFIQE